MQTFLPYVSFMKSAMVLDRQRLGKQRVEVLQILKAIFNGGGWSNHPAVRMWKDHPNALVNYGEAICQEWLERGYKDTCLEKIRSYLDPTQTWDRPSWLGDEDFHASHRSNLLRKNPNHYSEWGWEEPSDLPYVWPC